MSDPLLLPTLAEGDTAQAAQAAPQTLALMARRRSTKIAQMDGPGPDPEALRAILRLAVRAPDHGKLAPWRFVLLEGADREAAGAAMAAVQAQSGAGPDQIAVEHARFLRAPCVVVVVSRAAPHPKIPEWEQQLSAGAVCFAVLLAAHASGWAGCWLTEWPAYDARARAALGLAEHERIAGFLYLGTAREPAIERARPDLDSLISRFPGQGNRTAAPA